MTTPRLSNFQRVCVFIGFVCLTFATVAIAFDPARWQVAVAGAVIGIGWLFGSRLTYRD